MGARVEVISREWIKPSEPTPVERKLLKPSFLDQISPPCYIPLTFFYQNYSSSSFDPSERSQLLKLSLSDSLSKFYPIAGKVNPDLSVDCDDSGALFLESKVHAPFSLEFQNASLPIINQFLPFHPFEMEPEKLFDMYSRNEILFAVKFSWFECGSYVIGVCLNHFVGDVMCLVLFMNSWASTCCRESGHQLVPEPNFELGRRIFPALEPELLNSGSSSADSDQVEEHPPAVQVKSISKRLLFDNEKIVELKHLATSASSGSAQVKDPTRVEVVTAFIWKHLIKLARSKNEAAKPMFFIARHAVNVRSRMRSLNPDGEFAFGNFTMVTSASFKSSENEEEKDYHDLVSLTSKELRKNNEDYVIKNVQSNPLCYLNSVNPSGTEGLQLSDCYFTSWNRFPMYEVDFGWGNPVLVTPAGTPAGSGVVVLMGTKSGDGIEAWIGFKEDEIGLLEDEILLLAISDVFPAK